MDSTKVKAVPSVRGPGREEGVARGEKRSLECRQALTGWVGEGEDTVETEERKVSGKRARRENE